MFVIEDDVVSEQIPLPPSPASLTKIGTECTESSSNESIDPKGDIPGYCLVSMDSLKELATRIHSNSPCASGEIIIFSYCIFTFTIHIVFLCASIITVVVQHCYHSVIFLFLLF